MVNQKINQELSNNWSRKAVVYHIYPLSFKDSNGDGYGDIPGIIQSLDYLNNGTDQSLGVNAIWLSPIYSSPFVDNGYDITNYREIDPRFGTLEDFDRLVEEVHKRKMRIIMDFVPNHTSNQHPWFLESKSSKENSKRDWYIWRDPKPDGSPPNNWLSVFGGSAWEFDEASGQYYMHSFLKEQPDLNWRTKEVVDEMLEVMHFWLNRGIDGFRVDAIYHLLKDKKFRDDPKNPKYKKGQDPYLQFDHKYSQGLAETLAATDEMCSLIGTHKDKFMVSEAYLNVPEMMTMYSACANNLHAPFNFNMITMPWNPKAYRKHVDRFESHLGPNDWPNYAFGNHDRSRVATRMGRNRARLVALMALTFRGMPFIYYGDEIGMTDVAIPKDKVHDPFEKNIPGQKLGRDPERTPMQWNSERNAGFTTGEPWLPVGKDYAEYNVEKERNNPDSIFNLYRRLIHFKSTSPALLTGSYSSIDVDNDNIFAYVRECKEERLLVLVNFSHEEQEVSLDHVDLRQVCNAHCDEEFDKPIKHLKKFIIKGDDGYVFTF